MGGLWYLHFSRNLCILSKLRNFCVELFVIFPYHPFEICSDIPYFIFYINNLSSLFLFQSCLSLSTSLVFLKYHFFYSLIFSTVFLLISIQWFLFLTLLFPSFCLLWNYFALIYPVSWGFLAHGKILLQFLIHVCVSINTVYMLDMFI